VNPGLCFSVVGQRLNYDSIFRPQKRRRTRNQVVKIKKRGGGGTWGSYKTGKNKKKDHVPGYLARGGGKRDKERTRRISQRDRWGDHATAGYRGGKNNNP